MKQEKIIILGQSGSGKDFLLKQLINMGLKYLPKFTTRPKREFETEGVEYNFISTEYFNELKKEDKILVSQEFPIGGDIWYYGITKESYENSQLFIMTPYELSQLSQEINQNCFKVFLNIDEDIRRSRITKRNDKNDSVERRLAADRKDFENFKDYDLGISDPDFEAEWVYDLMKF